MNPKLILNWVAVILFVIAAGCSPTTSNGPVTGQTSQIVANALSNELATFGCQLDFDGTSLAGMQGRWFIERDADGASVWIEGDHTVAILEAFKSKFGEPASITSPDSNGYLSFQYRKDQCGVILICGVSPRSGWGLKAPLTSVGIHTKIALP